MNNHVNELMQWECLCDYLVFLCKICICDFIVVYKIISNGKYKSVEHRAIVNKHEPRMTIAVFCNPADDTIISPAPALLDEHHPPLYRPMTFGEFLASFFKKGLDGKGYVESFKNSSS